MPDACLYTIHSASAGNDHEYFKCSKSININPLKPNGNYMYQLLWQSVTLHL
jgi:hypothetical protein